MNLQEMQKYGEIFLRKQLTIKILKIFYNKILFV